MEEVKCDYKHLARANQIIKQAQSKGIIVDLRYLAALMAQEFGALETRVKAAAAIEKSIARMSKEESAAVAEANDEAFRAVMGELDEMGDSDEN